MLDFTITVGNRGSVVARDVVMTDTIPLYLDIIDATTTRGTTSIEGHTAIVTIGSVAPGDLVTIHIRTRINALAQPGVGYNSATVLSSQDSNPTNNTSTVTFVIIGKGTSQAQTPVVVLLVPTPVVVPPELPRTGAPNEETSSLPFLMVLGVIVIAAGLALRRRGAR